MGTERNKSVANARNEAALRAVKDQKMLEEARKKKEWDIRMAVAAETKKQELRVTALRAWQLGKTMVGRNRNLIVTGNLCILISCARRP